MNGIVNTNIYTQNREQLTLLTSWRGIPKKPITKDDTDHEVKFRKRKPRTKKESPTIKVGRHTMYELNFRYDEGFGNEMVMLTVSQFGAVGKTLVEEKAH